MPLLSKNLPLSMTSVLRILMINSRAYVLYTGGTNTMFSVLLILSTLDKAYSHPFKLELDQHWQNYKLQYNKTYKIEEELARRLIWEQTVENVNRHNLEADLGLHSYYMGINEYSDLANEEFVKTMNGYKNTYETSSLNFPISFDLKVPAEVDWRKKGLVSEVKNQGKCGSCWAFSATGSLEGQHAKKTGNMAVLSEQNLVDCSSSEGNYGCNGGLPNLAFRYVEANGGIDTEASYPYEAKDDRCRFNRSAVGATCMGYLTIPKGYEIVLMRAVASIGPISVGIDASHSSFQNYRSGIYDEPRCSSTRLDHAVLIVGYSSEGDKDYWIVKNSWGTSWGMKGYIWMSRNKSNQCGIASEASFPLV